MIKKTFLAGSFAALAFSGGANAAVYDLAFIMDGSGSVGSYNYGQAMTSLANALNSSLDAATLAQDQYNISVVTFSASGSAVVSAQMVDEVSDLAAVTSAITSASYANSTTNYAAAFNTLLGISGAVSAGSAGSIINMMTDGKPVPFCIDSCAQTVDDITSGRNALRDAGWDSLSFEAVTSGPDTDFLATLAFDTTGVGTTNIIDDETAINDPLNETFVLKVNDFGADFDAAIAAKVAKIVDPDPVSPVPVPASLPLLVGGLGLFGFISRRRRKAA